MNNNLINKHLHCQVSIRWKLFRGQEIPTPGLFCTTHDLFLEWLTYDTALALIKSGVKEEGYTCRQAKRNREKENRKKWIYGNKTKKVK